MKKSELKVGVEYAVLLSPGAVRRFTNGRGYSTDAPLRVKLLAKDTVEKLWDRGSYSSSHSKRDVKGHKVTLPTNRPDFKAKLRITVYETALEPSLTRQERVMSYGGKPTQMFQADWERDSLLLESAGCFISTWEDYEADVAATAAMKKRHADERAAKERKADEAAPEVIALRDRVLAKLAAYGEVKERSGYRRDDQAYGVEVEAFGGFKITGEYRYVEGVEEDVLAGAKITMNLHTLAVLLEAL